MSAATEAIALIRGETEDEANTAERIADALEAILAEDEGKFDTLDPVLGVQLDATLDPGASPTEGDRYILTDAAHLHTNFGTIADVANSDVVEYVAGETDAFVVVTAVVSLVRPVSVVVAFGARTWLWDLNCWTAQATVGDVDVVDLEPVTLTFANPLAPNCNDGLYRKVTMTNDASLSAPSNGADGMVWRGRFTASGANRELTLGANILTPTDVVFDATIASGSTRVLWLESNGTKWMLTRNLEFVA